MKKVKSLSKNSIALYNTAPCSIHRHCDSVLNNMLVNNFLCYIYTSLIFIYSDLGVYPLAVLVTLMNFYVLAPFIVLDAIPVDAVTLPPSDLVLYSD